MSLKDARQLVGNIADAVSEIVQYNLDNTAFEVCDYLVHRTHDCKMIILLCYENCAVCYKALRTCAEPVFDLQDFRHKTPQSNLGCHALWSN